MGQKKKTSYYKDVVGFQIMVEYPVRVKITQASEQLEHELLHRGFLQALRWRGHVSLEVGDGPLHDDENGVEGTIDDGFSEADDVWVATRW